MSGKVEIARALVRQHLGTLRHHIEAGMPLEMIFLEAQRKLTNSAFLAVNDFDTMAAAFDEAFPSGEPLPAPPLDLRDFERLAEGLSYVLLNGARDHCGIVLVAAKVALANSGKEALKWAAAKREEAEIDGAMARPAAAKKCNTL